MLISSDEKHKVLPFSYLIQMVGPNDTILRVSSLSIQIRNTTEDLLMWTMKDHFRATHQAFAKVDSAHDEMQMLLSKNRGVQTKNS
jgi:hypothetical protein